MGEEATALETIHIYPKPQETMRSPRESMQKTRAPSTKLKEWQILDHRNYEWRKEEEQTGMQKYSQTAII